MRVLLVFLLMFSIAQADCRVLIPKVKNASEFVLGINYPYQFNLGQIEVETNCFWRTSLDGIGSIGYAQITPVYWDKVLKKYFYNWKQKDSFDYFLSQAYIIKDAQERAKIKKLWVVYQIYNRNAYYVNREAVEGHGNWERALDVCVAKYNQSICVWRQGGVCKQWRGSCDINYEYSLKVYKQGIKYQGVECRYW
jgi:hypothetical protein